MPRPVQAMIDAPTRRRILGGLTYVLIVLALILIRIMPLETAVSAWPGPDLVLAITLAWVLRRPDQLPVLLIATVFLAEDILILRPLGLWAILAVLATEFLRRREHSLRDLPFLAEWALVAGMLATMLLAQRMALLLTFTPRPLLGQAVLQLLATLAAYPFVVAIARSVFGLRRRAPGEVDEYGQRR